MRKITLFLLALVCTVGAWGEVPALTVSSDGAITYYTIKNYRSGKYAKWTGDATQIAQTAELDDACYWYVLANGEDGYTLCNKSTQNKYAGHSSFTAEGAKTYIKENPYNEGYVCVSLTSDLSGNCWDDQDSETKVGYWYPQSGDYEGTSWTLEKATGNVDRDYLKMALDKVKAGTKLGCCPQEAIDAAKAVYDSENGDYAAAKTALENARIVPVSGRYYRIENTAMDNYYLGLDGYTMNMKHNEVSDESTYDNNPGIIWQYVEEGNKAYMKNLYAGLYPQYIPGGSDATATIGTGKDYAFTYALYAGPTDTEAAKWNISFGDRQVNCEGSDGNVGKVNYWFGDNAHYYIYEVETPEADLENLCGTYYATNVKADEDVSNVEKIDIDADATVIISPTEFADPLVINNVIDMYKDKLNLAAEGATQAKVHDLFAAMANWSVVRTYQNAVNSYGALKSIAYTTPDAEYGTIILPINWAVPEGWTVSTCDAAPGGVLTLGEQSGQRKNKPYIIQLGESERNKTYQFIGYSNGAATTNQTEGLLTGVLEEGAKVPAGSYILSKYNDVLGFYRVAEGVEFTASVNKCYLTLPAESAARFEALFFEGTETAINDVFDTQAKQNGGIYNMAGQRLGKLQKGLNIVNGKVVLVK